MIDEVHIRDVALIREAFFEPSAGMTVVTGETGAGKTALLAACRLLAGQRADASLVRAGCGELKVEGRFILPGSCLEPAAEEGAEEGLDCRREVVVQRRLGANGRSRAMLDGDLAPVKRLAQAIAPWLDVCAQHEHQSLLDPLRQRELMDRWGGSAIAGAKEAYQRSFRHVGKLKAELVQLKELENAGQAELDRARYALDRIEAVDPQPGEYEELAEEMPRFEHAEALALRANEALEAVQGSDEQAGALTCLEAAMSATDAIAEVDASMASVAEVVREAFFTLDDAARELARYADGIEFSPQELEARQRRFADLQGLMRGFGPAMSDVFESYDEAATLLSAYESRGEALCAKREELEQARTRMVQDAKALAAARAAVAPEFCQAVGRQMERLEMGRAFVEVRMEDLHEEKWSAWGPQGFELLFSPAPGIEPQRLSKIASGGELSRVMLAIKVVLGACDEVETLVFDEVDAGVGGHTAASLGAVLRDLACSHQVIVVTHLAQVAVLADKHYVVRKVDDAPGAGPMPSSGLHTVIEEVSGKERDAEVARMLSGTVDEASLAHARTLRKAAEQA